MGTDTSTGPRLLPVSGYQRLMLFAAQDVQTTDTYHQLHTPSLAFRVTPRASARVLKHAFAKLVRRHDSLRLRFVRHDGDWKAEILPEHPTGLITEDISDLPQDAQMAHLMAVDDPPLTALSPALFDMRLFKCGRFGDVIVIRAHHSITDGYGFTLMIEDLLKFLLNLPVRTAAVTHEEFITRQLQEIDKNREAAEAFWHDHLMPPPPEPNIGRVARGLPRASSRNEGPRETLDNVLNAAQSRQLDAMTRDTGLSGFSYLYAAFAETLCDLADQDDILIDSILGRRDAHLMNFVGAEIQEVVLRFTRGARGIEDSAAQVQEKVADATRHTPTDLFYQTDGWIASQIRKSPVHGKRFFAHNLMPAGRLESSPFGKFLSNAMHNKVSMGFITFEKIDLFTNREISELFLSVSKTDDGPNAALLGLGDAFPTEALITIAAGMRDKLGLADIPADAGR